MARTAIATHVVTRDGLDESTVTPDAADVANGNVIDNNGRMWVEIKNTNATSTAHDVTFTLSGGADGQTITPRTVTVEAGKTLKLGPWPVDIYGGALKVNGAHAELTIAAYELAV